MLTQNITLDFCRNDYKTITVKQRDKNSRNLIITCTNNGSIYRIDGSTQECKYKMSTPDNRAIYKNATINNDGTILITFDDNMLYEPGTGKLEIQILEQSTNYSLSTMILTVIIVGNVFHDDVITASDEFSALTDALLNIEDSTNKAKDTVELANKTIDRIEILETEVSTNESNRIEAENERINAENIRIQNENKRQSNVAKAISDTETATENAIKATNDVIKATNDAERATELANIATENANEVTELAISATSNANEATEKANITIERAEVLENSVTVAEADRKNAEITRRENEVIRESNETERIANEEARQLNASTVLENVEKAVETANTAVNNANKAAEDAREATNEAKAVLTSKVNVSDVIDELTGIEENAEKGKVAGALAVKELFEKTEKVRNNFTDSILNTMEEIEANTQEDQLAGALAVKELINNDAIKNSAVHSYIKKDGSLGNIHNDFTERDTKINNKLFALNGTPNIASLAQLLERIDVELGYHPTNMYALRCKFTDTSWLPASNFNWCRVFVSFQNPPTGTQHDIGGTIILDPGGDYIHIGSLRGKGGYDKITVTWGDVIGSRKPIIGQTVIVPLCDIGITDANTGNIDTSVIASLSLVRLGYNRANIVINYRIAQNCMSKDMYRFIDMSKLKSALGLSTLAFHHAQTTVSFKPAVTHSGDTVTYYTSYAAHEHHGYTGIVFNEEGGLGRIHSEQGWYGNWSLSEPVYMNNSYGSITINGAEVAFA